MIARTTGILLAVLLAGCARTVRTIEIDPPSAEPTFATRVRPILEQRCVVCHACSNAPCQLNLQSYEGLERGSSHQLVYDSTRATAAPPTRMFQDATSTAQWRRLGFFPVLSHSRLRADSVLFHFIAQRRRDSRGGDFEAEKGVRCFEGVPAVQQYLDSRPEAGMPYGFPPLDDAQFQTIVQWLDQGAPPPPEPPPPTAAVEDKIRRWERFFNDSDLRSRLVARYLYEHLFLAHLHFGAGQEYFRLVRSRTAAPAPIDEIVTVRPYDDPKTARVRYRLVPLTETIVHKTHVPFALTDHKLARFRALFLEPAWKLEALPGYAAKVAGNPFVTFAAIPPRARYQFMLDDAHYHVRAFIHGPVCKGPTALNVIDEQFWILFLDPSSDPTVNDPKFLREAAEDLSLPAEGKDTTGAFYEQFKLAQLRYLKKRNALDTTGRQLKDLWDGDGHNRDALLTVFRHFDSASVSRGALGGTPKTGWVIDYPIFERIYYNLVAGFSVYGNVSHQLATRQYMDNLRVESEDGFLRFLPRSERGELRASWYRGAGMETYMNVINPFFGSERETGVQFKEPRRAKEELWAQVRTARLSPQVAGDRRAPPELMLPLADRATLWARAFPDLTLLRVGDEVYSIILNRAHLNVAFMFLERSYRAPQEDSLSIVRGQVGSYPNLLLTVEPGQLARFIEQLRSIRSDDDSWRRFVDTWGVRRNSRDFWSHFDWFAARQRAAEPIEGGLLDLNRYQLDER